LIEPHAHYRQLTVRAGLDMTPKLLGLQTGGMAATLLAKANGV
jgi:hypothetical protein